MKIEFVNHASFIFENKGVKIISDPWIFGSAFHNGWRLLCESKFDFDRFKDIQYIWFSHEHPDHFSPPVIKAIKKEYRNKITVLFQETKDKKVINFCSDLGFKVKELKDHKQYDLEGGIKVMCGGVLFFDSWLCFYVEDKKILNVNDCIVDGEVKANIIKKHTGKVDVLLTQFSYAAWKGAPSDKSFRKEAARNKLNIMKTQMKVFSPKYTIPFASFVYFSHEENKYMNDGINTPQDACNAIQEANSCPIVLYPGNIWNLSEQWDNKNSLASYKKEYSNIDTKLYEKAEKSFSEEELKIASKKYIERIKNKNNFLLINFIKSLGVLDFFKPFKIFVYDIGKIFVFDINKGLVSNTKNDSSWDVRIHSESLDYVFKFNWGFDTLTVNGRFESTLEGFSIMAKNFSIGPLNNTGRYVGLLLLFDIEIIVEFISAMKNFIRKMKRKR